MRILAGVMRGREEVGEFGSGALAPWGRDAAREISSGHNRGRPDRRQQTRLDVVAFKAKRKTVKRAGARVLFVQPGCPCHRGEAAGARLMRARGDRGRKLRPTGGADGALLEACARTARTPPRRRGGKETMSAKLACRKKAPIALHESADMRVLVDGGLVARRCRKSAGQASSSRETCARNGHRARFASRPRGVVGRAHGGERDGKVASGSGASRMENQ